jgi:hypothetical protein
LGLGKRGRKRKHRKEREERGVAVLAKGRERKGGIASEITMLENTEPIGR